MAQPNLTEGPLLKRLIAFFLPIAAGLLFQQLYNAVDAVVVGKTVGTEALAAVGGSPAVISNLIIGFCNALAGGASVVIAQLYGARRHEQVHKAVSTSFWFCALLGIAVGAAVIGSGSWLLRLLKTPEDTFAFALTYLRIYFAGSIFMLVYNIGAGILRAVGNARFPFVCLVAGCVVNIVLDILFVMGFHRGVAGAAWATVIAQAVSAVMVTVRLCVEKNVVHLKLFPITIDRKLLGKMMSIGVPSGLQASMYGISNTILQVGVNTLGTVVVASWTMSGKLDGTYWSISSAFGTAITTFIGQNYGAAKYGRIRKCCKDGLIFFLAVTAAMSVIILAAAKPLLTVLTDDVAVRDTTWVIMLYFVPVYLIWSLIEFLSGVLRGTGDALVPSVILAGGICGSRMIWVVTVFRAFRTLPALCICYPMSWFLTDAVLIWYYKKKSRIAKMPKEDAPCSD